MTSTFADLTTMRVGGPVSRLETVHSTAALVEAVREADAEGTELLLIGGGSNLLVGDGGFDGLTVRIASSGMRIDGARVHVDAGVPWDHVVRRSLEAGLTGLSALSGIPGTAGATPIQDVGAYGTSVSEWLETVTVFDRSAGEVQVWDNARCGFGSARNSVFKNTDRYVVLDLTFLLEARTESAPVRYAALADRLGVRIGDRVPAHTVREAVLGLRSDRGMVLDPDDHDTWSVGSFFLNPIVRRVPDAAAGSPQFPDPRGTKLSAAWLIDNAGFHKGYGAEVGTGRARLSTRHALAITNRGGATTADVTTLARRLVDGVDNRYGIALTPECTLVNCSIG